MKSAILYNCLRFSRTFSNVDALRGAGKMASENYIKVIHQALFEVDSSLAKFDPLT